MQPYADRIRLATELLHASETVVAFTGAGISTESGVADFRSPGGIWERYRIVTYQEFLASREARQEYWRMKNELIQEFGAARPNAAHHALAELEARGKLKCVVTQNIDGLHQDAGSANVLEIHGTNRFAVCVQCGWRWPIEEVRAMLEQSAFDPRCESCGGFVKPATISFGQAMPEQKMRDAYAYAQKSDLMLMVGSSLQVEPAASIPRAAHHAGAKLIFINRTETPFDHLAAVLFQENAGQVLRDLLAAKN
ncbi:MAG: NAD-dependent deacetylase [Nitrospirae bacterium]|nr:MAG: NAD-dependent deacetylase [Nitrospirota bacterium]